ncbi:MAG: 1-acyl-sn-glycerol-3-phosphate acyltransferase [Bacteroidales bacterium]|nr:1-acyl-sn-glycerol-3-phosphate acyltransferase [Bacteroidales bacterium]
MDFSHFAPYKDEEVPAAIANVVKNELFSTIVRQLNPILDPKDVKNAFLKISTVDEFQHHIMLPLILHVLRSTTDEFTISGLEQLSRDESYLFIANHRDIALDAAILSIQLLRHSYKVPAVSFGDNLITNPYVKTLTRLNRMFPVFRGGTRREFYESSVLLSNYIIHVLEDEKRNVWIAQRNGRTKDGDDRTEPGLLKMLSMAGEGDFVEHMERLRIVPLCISYEYEPCADSKAREINKIKQGAVYVKRHGEDILHIWEGISQQKGMVHLAVCKPITRGELEQCAASADTEADKNAPYQALAHLIDRRIWSEYRLSGMNRLAYEIVTEKASKDIIYTAKQLFRNDTLLKIYAQPVINQNLALNNP